MYNLKTKKLLKINFIYFFCRKIGDSIDHCRVLKSSGACSINLASASNNYEYITIELIIRARGNPGLENCFSAKAD